MAVYSLLKVPKHTPQREKKGGNEMAQTEKIEVKSVDGPNDNGWYEVELSDGRKSSTKDEAVAKEAFARLGEEVDAVIGTTTKGNFTNIYLNQINGVGDLKPAARRSSGAARSGGGSAAPAKDTERIARQWAYGRATELLIAAGGPAAFPLSPEDMSNLSAQAKALLDATKS